MQRNWCEVCRGGSDGGADLLLPCSSCPRKFHRECAGLGLGSAAVPGRWRCAQCCAAGGAHDAEGAGGHSQKKRKPISAVQKRTAAVRKAHRAFRANSRRFVWQQRENLLPFVGSTARLEQLTQQPTGKAAAGPAGAGVPMIGSHEPYITAQLRDYQVDGVNWILSQYNSGAGGILGDEMGLGKTIQTLSFISALKAAGQPGPHLVVTPLAVLINWTNEIKKFTPGLSFCKIHGSQDERDRILTTAAILEAEYDVYLTTYDMILSEEAFFTETFLFHTITIDEGHRLKNENSSLSAALSRISCPFRLLLTGTPIQNSMHELSALLHYIVPDVIDACMFDTTCDRDTGVVDQRAVANARGLLESLMIRRVKAEVEKSLLPKKEYVLRVPLSALQRVWYQRVLTKASGATELVSASQLSAKVMQLQKICNHPKTVVLQFDRDRAAARRTAARAAGSEYIKVHGTELGAEAMEMEAELRALGGPSSLAAASGKLALLDRLLLRKKAEGSRVLLFSQYTLALDVLEEYCGQKFGRAGYLRLDGTTNRIDREMDVRSFNAAGSPVFIYLISTRAGGQGINLASADTVVLYDTCWNPQVDLQAEDRAHRIGQRKQVKVYRLISESTMEERILATARQKLFIDKLVIKDAGAVGRAGGAQHRAAVADEQDQTDDEQSVSELWATLCHGAAALLDPAKNGRMLAAEDYDAIIDGAVERTEDDATIAQAETADTIVGGADGAAMAGAAAMAVQAASATAATVTAAEVTKSKLVTNYDLSAYGKTRLLAIGMVGLQQLCQDRGIWNPTFGPSEAAAALLQWKSNRAQMAQAAVDLTGDTMNGLDRRGRKGRGIGAKRYAPPLGALEKKVGKQARKLRHDDDCFCCDDGGDLLQCDVCPRVYHLECIGLKTAPKGTWHCPWHLCWTCKRKSSSAGGKLFHCMTCPETFCFDCVPDRYVQKNDKKALALAASLESRGCRSIKNFLFFRCDNCVKDGKKQHSADASAHAKKKRANGLDGISTIPANRASLPVSPPDGAVDLGSPHDRVHAGRIQPINADVSVPPASTAPPQKRPHQTAFEASRRTEDDSEDDSDDVEKFGHQAEESDKKNVSDEDEGDSLDDELRAATERAERAATAAAAQIAAGPQPGDLDAIQRAIASWEAAKLQGAVRSNTRPQQQRLLMLMPASSDLYSKKVQYRPGQFRPGERRRRRVQDDDWCPGNS